MRLVLNWQGLGDERISGHKLLDLSVKSVALAMADSG